MKKLVPLQIDVTTISCITNLRKKKLLASNKNRNVFHSKMQNFPHIEEVLS